MKTFEEWFERYSKEFVDWAVYMDSIPPNIKAFMSTAYAAGIKSVYGDEEAKCFCGDIYSPDVNLNACIVIQATGHCPNCITMEMREFAYHSAQAGWQPIETAPESGTFLVYGGMFRSELYADSKTREAVIVSGRAPYTMFHNKGDILFYVAGENYPEEWVVNPTHWMPLPEAPQGEEK